MQASRFDAAATIYAELVAARPGDAGLLMNLGMALHGRSSRPGGGPIAEGHSAQPRPCARDRCSSVHRCSISGQPKEPTPLQKAVTAMPDNADAREMLACCQLMLSVSRRGRELSRPDRSSARQCQGLVRHRKEL
jgi:hypothetical protein